MFMTRTNREWPMGVKGWVGIASCVLGLGVVYFGYGIGTESPKKTAGAELTAPSQPSSNRPVQAMNLALGNMVFFAHDLGFNAKTVNNGPHDPAKLTVRLENQLQELRKIYREEATNNPSLVGGITLQIHIDPSGEVSRVKELASVIADSEFRKTVVAEAYKWSFVDIVAEPVIVSCSLLFVREGMDITTLVQWEKALGHLTDKNNPTRATAAGKQNAATEVAAAAKPNNATAPIHAAERAKAKPVPRIFQIKYATSLRPNPNFSSAPLTSFTIGTKVAVINRQGDWLEVKTTDNRFTGYIRKEFVTPVDVVRH